MPNTSILKQYVTFFLTVLQLIPAIGISGLSDVIGLDAVEKLVATKKNHCCWSRLGHNSFFFFLILNPLRHCGAASQAEILGTASGAEMADI